MMHGRILCGGLLTLSVFAFGFDPYSFGWTGGDVFTDRRYWQIAAALFLVILVLIAGASLVRGDYGRSVKFLVTELVVLTLFNVVYVTRDGGTRFFSGYEGAPLPLFAMVAVVVLQITVLVYAWSKARHVAYAS
jgi:energy-coupling factor transporter transmembrane protein EcfT